VGKLDGKVALITGAARGQGRSHAVRLAQEGADVIAVDICEQLDTVPYPMATPEDLQQTVKEVEALDRRIVATRADVRDLGALQEVVRDGVAQLGRLDIVLANAGIAPMGDDADPGRAFRDVVDVNLTGVWNTVRAAAPVMVEQGEGGAIVLTSSTAGLKGIGGGSPGGEGYTAAKHGVVAKVRMSPTTLAPHRIRVNSVHPTGVNTPMIVNDFMQQWLAEAGEGVAGALSNLLPVDLLEPVDISNAILFLVSDDARYITGVTLPVDAGFTTK
jgi:SDR family mycofactocin-dependent oxidoreductase